jgi:hypothetical protein
LRAKLESRIKKCEAKLNPAPKSYIFIDYGDGKGQKQAVEILKAEPDADVMVILWKWVK